MRTNPQQEMKYLIIIVTATVLAFNPGTSIAADKGNTPVVTTDQVQKIQSLAEQGDARAQCGLGIMYSSGEGVPKNYTEALKWYRLSAEQGNAYGQFGLGVMYKNGDGVIANRSMAKEWFGKACDNGYQKGCDQDRELSLQGK